MENVLALGSICVMCHVSCVMFIFNFTFLKLPAFLLLNELPNADASSMYNDFTIYSLDTTLFLGDNIKFFFLSLVGNLLNGHKTISDDSQKYSHAYKTSTHMQNILVIKNKSESHILVILHVITI